MSTETRHDGRLYAELVLDRLSADERERAARVESILPALRAAAELADREGRFHLPHVATFRDAGLLGLIVPREFGGMGGSLRDLAAATFAMGTACPSTALTFFFHCSSASRGLLALEALEAGLFSEAEAPIVRAFARKLLGKMGERKLWLANFASESTKTSKTRVTITTEATATTSGFLLNGVKSFGAATGVADEYLVTAKLAGTDTADGLALFFVKQKAQGVSERAAWDSIGMRATANMGIVLKDVFVAEDEALAIPGAFVKMMQMSRGTFVGNQLAGQAIYVGAAQSVFDHAVSYLSKTKFADTGQPLAMSPMHQQILGRMTTDLEEAYLWLRRQIDLETSEPPLVPKPRVVRQWRMAKGSMCEAAFRVGVGAFKACGTSNTGMSGPISRALRDLSLGLVQAFPAERGRLEAAEMVVLDKAADDFSVAKK